MTLRLFVALLAAYLFLRDLGCGEAPALLGAVGWGFSDFLVFWLGFPVGNSVGPFPLLLLGLSRLARDSDRRAVGLTTCALVLIVTAGHPETLLFAVAGGGVYFLFQLAFADRARRLPAVLLSLVAGAAALGLTAVQLLPLAEAMPQTHEHAVRSGYFADAKKGAPLIESARRGLTFPVPFAYGESGRSNVWKDFGPPAVYAGSILFPLAWTGLYSRNRQRWIFMAMGLLGAALWLRLAVVTDAVASLPLFEISILEYCVFLAVFALSALAALGAERLCHGEGLPAFLVGTGLSALADPGRFSIPSGRDGRSRHDTGVPDVEAFLGDGPSGAGRSPRRLRSPLEPSPVDRSAPARPPPGIANRGSGRRVSDLSGVGVLPDSSCSRCDPSAHALPLRGSRLRAGAECFGPLRAGRCPRLRGHDPARLLRDVSPVVRRAASLVQPGG